MGKFNFKETAKEASIKRLDNEIRLMEMYRQGAVETVGPEAEAYFEAWVKGRHGHKLIRHGWPDYMLLDATTGMPFCVEVKTDSDRMSRRQETCFLGLEKGGIRVFIWSPTKPKTLEPFRAYLARTRTYRSDK
jgi:hypothetical protein